MFVGFARNSEVKEDSAGLKPNPCLDHGSSTPRANLLLSGGTCRGLGATSAKFEQNQASIERSESLLRRGPKVWGVLFVDSQKMTKAQGEG